MRFEETRRPLCDAPSATLALIVALVSLAGPGCVRQPDAAKEPCPEQASEDVSRRGEPQALQPVPGSGELSGPGKGSPETGRLATPRLTIGDEAPPLTISRWVKGKPVDALESGQVYVVEFWATWCGPCRRSMPHISQLQERLGKDVTFIGVSDEPEEKVQSFFKRPQNPETGETWGQVVKYTIAVDQERVTHAAYMKAAGQNGIPTAFVVGRDGHIEWIGHPMTIEEPLGKILGGTWDREAARAEFTIARALRAAQRNRNWAEAIELLDRAIEQFPTNGQFKVAKFKTLLAAEEFATADALADELAKENWDNPQLLNEISWLIVTKIPKPHQSLDLALRIAIRASSLENDENAMILDTVARIYHEQGQLEEAIKWQRQAVEHNSGGIGSIDATLRQYEAELPGPEDEPTAEAGNTGPL